MRNFSIRIVILIATFSACAGAKPVLYSDSLYLQWSRSHIPLVTPGDDVPAACVASPDGGLYMTGKSDGVGTDYDFLTIKVDAYGNEQWRAVYDGPYHGTDIPVALALDVTGSVWVTGMSVASEESSFDIVTIKYGSDGLTEWIQRYEEGSGTNYTTEAPADLVVDDNGNAFVVGFQPSAGDGREFLTIKYNAAGGQEWVATYSGPENMDEARTVTLDPSGNIYVSGTSRDSFEASSAITIKYTSDGNEMWQARHRANDSSLTTPVRLRVDPEGNLIVAANVSIAPSWNPSVEHQNDILLIKYASDGSILWEALYDSSPHIELSPDIIDLVSGMDIDASGNIYLCGSAGVDPPYQMSGDSLLTVKYSPLGSRLWVAFRSNGADRAVQSSGMTVSSDGTVTVAGMFGRKPPPEEYGYGTFYGDSIVAVQYSPYGVFQRMLSFGSATSDTVREAKAIAVDSDGNIIIVGDQGLPRERDFITSKFSDAGNMLWRKNASGGGRGNALAFDTRIDHDGNMYVVGSANPSPERFSIAAWKLNPAGQLVWTCIDDSEVEDLSSHPIAVEVDNRGNLLILSNVFKRSENELVARILKVDSAGSLQWAELLETDWAYTIAPDSFGNVYVGTCNGLAKFDREGNLDWTSWEACSFGSVVDIVTDNAGFIYTAASWTIDKYTPEGIQLWSVPVGGDGVFNLALDDSGFLYGTTDYYPPMTIKLDTAGIALWESEYGSTRMFINSAGVYVGCGEAVDKLDTQGNHLWSYEVDAIAPYWKEMWVDSAGNTFLSYSEWDQEYSDFQIVVTKLDPDGDEQWSMIHGDADGNSHLVSAIGTDHIGNLFILGEEWLPDGITTPFVAKYGHDEVVGVSSGEYQTSVFALMQNYPNPFNPVTNIEFRVAGPGEVTLKIYDIIGREVATLVNEQLLSGIYKTSFDGKGFSSGMYFCRLTSGNQVQVRAMMLVK